MSVLAERLRKELTGYLEERKLLNQVIRETRSELRKQEARDKKKGIA